MLRKPGMDIHDIHHRRQLPMAGVVERAFTSRFTLQRVEAGSRDVGILQALGLLDGLNRVADIRNDSVGLTLAHAEQPGHIHLKQPPGPPRNG